MRISLTKIGFPLPSTQYLPPPSLPSLPHAAISSLLISISHHMRNFMAELQVSAKTSAACPAASPLTSYVYNAHTKVRKASRAQCIKNDIKCVLIQCAVWFLFAEPRTLLRINGTSTLHRAGQLESFGIGTPRSM